MRLTVRVTESQDRRVIGLGGPRGGVCSTDGWIWRDRFQYRGPTQHFTVTSLIQIGGIIEYGRGGGGMRSAHSRRGCWFTLHKDVFGGGRGRGPTFLAPISRNR